MGLFNFKKRLENDEEEFEIVNPNYPENRNFQPNPQSNYQPPRGRGRGRKQSNQPYQPYQPYQGNPNYQQNYGYYSTNQPPPQQIYQQYQQHNPQYPNTNPNPNPQYYNPQYPNYQQGYNEGFIFRSNNPIDIEERQRREYEEYLQKMEIYNRQLEEYNRQQQLYQQQQLHQQMQQQQQQMQYPNYSQPQMQPPKSFKEPKVTKQPTAPIEQPIENKGTGAGSIKYGNINIDKPKPPRRENYNTEEDFLDDLALYTKTYSDPSFKTMRTVTLVGFLSLAALLFTKTTIISKILAVIIALVLVYIGIRVLFGKETADNITGHSKIIFGKLGIRFHELENSYLKRKAYLRYKRDYEYRVSHGYEAPEANLDKYMDDNCRPVGFDRFINKTKDTKVEPKKDFEKMSGQRTTNNPTTSPTPQDLEEPNTWSTGKFLYRVEIRKTNYYENIKVGIINNNIKNLFNPSHELQEVFSIDGNIETVIGENLKIIKTSSNNLRIFASKDVSNIDVSEMNNPTNLVVSSLDNTIHTIPLKLMGVKNILVINENEYSYPIILESDKQIEEPNLEYYDRLVDTEQYIVKDIEKNSSMKEEKERERSFSNYHQSKETIGNYTRTKTSNNPYGEELNLDDILNDNFEFTEDMDIMAWINSED